MQANSTHHDKAIVHLFRADKPEVDGSSQAELVRESKHESQPLVLLVGAMLILSLGLWLGRITAPSMQTHQQSEGPVYGRFGHFDANQTAKP